MKTDERQAGEALSSELLPGRFNVEIRRVLQRIFACRGEFGTSVETQDDLMFHELCFPLSPACVAFNSSNWLDCADNTDAFELGNKYQNQRPLAAT